MEEKQCWKSASQSYSFVLLFYRLNGPPALRVLNGPFIDHSLRSSMSLMDRQYSTLGSEI